MSLADRVFEAAFGRQVSFDADALPVLAGHGWPGNLHELGQVARMMAASAPPAMSGSRLRLGRADFPPQLQAARDGGGGEDRILARHLHDTGWNISETARRMGVNRSTIHRQIQRHGLRRP
ncbi:helix-turn-helix domain-containing protein [Mangrovicoccus ximenensis]|uniref:helix-turn-helix domain-containing protein n=1 Tax=Mangrovicoccus ximenensis TaxID=1911570 RepID=UPI00191BF6D4|nr:helix-turn-helix domain-containing protein [Mangrovicoccus ximenensis]